jgi:hypothetical protein
VADATANALEAFLAGRQRSKWIELPGLRVYARKSSRLFQESLIDCLDIGAVEVDEGLRGRGVFREFLGVFEKVAEASGRTVYVENVMNPLLDSMLRRRQYTPIHDAVHCACFFGKRG